MRTVFSEAKDSWDSFLYMRPQNGHEQQSSGPETNLGTALSGSNEGCAAKKGDPRWLAKCGSFEGKPCHSYATNAQKTEIDRHHGRPSQHGAALALETWRDKNLARPRD